MVWLPIKKGITHMINWIEYDPENPPADFEIYLIYQEYNGKDEVCTAYMMGGQWFTCQGTEAVEGITYYGDFNLPGEDKSDVTT
jgi:hypothetical protein